MNKEEIPIPNDVQELYEKIVPIEVREMFDLSRRFEHKQKLKCNKAWRLANKDKVKESGKAYYWANKEKIAEKKKAYYLANKEKINLIKS